MTERRTPLYDFHFRSARNVVKGGGDFMFPTSYTSPVEEHLNVVTNVVIGAMVVAYVTRVVRYRRAQAAC